MFRKSIKQKIVGIAAGLIVLAVITSLLSMVMSARVGHLLDELTNRYVPAYGDLARANIRSLERSLALRQMIIAKMQTPPDEAAYAAHLKSFQSLEPEIEKEAQAARDADRRHHRRSPRRRRTMPRSAVSTTASTPRSTICIVVSTNRISCC